MSEMAKRRGGAVWLCVLLSCSLGEAQELGGYLAAEQKLEERQWGKARSLYKIVVETGPDYLRPHAMLGFFRASAGLGEGAAALRLIASLVDDNELLARDREFWLAAIALERAKISPEEESREESIRQLREVLKIIDVRNGYVRLRAEVRLAMAELLSGAGQGRRAIKILTESLPELRSAEWAGLRAYQKAQLAKIYMGIGERDWAVSLLEEIRHDPQLDSRHFKVAEAFIEGRILSQSSVTGLIIRDEPSCLSVESPGCFEFRISASKGEDKLRLAEKGQVVTHWFNLQKDPFRTVNLLQGGSLLEVIDSSRIPVPVPAMIELLESSSARVRFQRRNLSLPSPRIEEYTVYPSGQIFVFIRAEETGPPEPGMALLLTTPFFGNPNGWQVISPEGNLPVKAGAAFEGRHLLLSRVPLPASYWLVPDDLLLLPGQAGARLITHVPLDPRLSMRRKVSCEQCGKGGRVAVQLRITPSFLEKPDLAEKYRGAYQDPAELIAQGGNLVTDEPGDLNSDGYNEGEGCHVVRGTRAVEFRAGAYDRVDPVIKFVLPGFVGLPDVRIDGRIANSSSYNLCWERHDTLILRWNGTIPAGGRSLFTLE